MSLSEWGWKPFFQQQLSLEELESLAPGRVVEQHRSQLLLGTENASIALAVTPALPALTVGDWLLLDRGNHFARALERASLFSRKAPGSKAQEQLIAANVDVVFIVSSLNQDFSLSRIERYLALANDAGAEPVVVLTRLDCCDDPHFYLQQAQSLNPLLVVEAVNALDAESVAPLNDWCAPGQTVAFLGSSGVGKSTLINTLMGEARLATGGIREDDAKGRHTTTQRSISMMPRGGLLLDTPGMRELQLADCEDGVSATFADISALARQCRFADCQHESEPGCAVQAALANQELDARRLGNYRKLMREQALNAATLAERRAGDRKQRKFHKSVQSAARQQKKGL